MVPSVARASFLEKSVTVFFGDEVKGKTFLDDYKEGKYGCNYRHQRRVEEILRYGSENELCVMDPDVLHV